jgi:hypothetical protein
MDFNLLNRFEFAGGGWLRVEIRTRRAGEIFDYASGDMVAVELAYILSWMNDDKMGSKLFPVLSDALTALAAIVAKGEAGGFGS